MEKNIQYEYERTAVICMFSKIISYPSRLETWSLHEQASDIWRGVKAISVPLLLLTDTMHCNHVDIIVCEADLYVLMLFVRFIVQNLTN